LTVRKPVHILETVPPHDEDPFLPVLLKPGRGVYGLFIRDALTEAGFTDMPANGGYVLGLIGPDGTPLSEVIADLGVSKQTASQLVDTLVIRGYLERNVDPDDRRRMLLALTERGAAASELVYATAQEVNARLVAVVGPERVAHTRETLAALIALRDPATGNDDGG
jgi:DNA-binding MarR family transcriptional regulator